MLPKTFRLNLKQDFKPIMAQGQSLNTPNFRLIYLPTTELVAKVGIALSGKSFKTQPLKQRAKRLTATAMTELYPNLRPGLKVVIIPKPAVLDKNPELLKLELKNVKALFNSH